MLCSQIVRCQGEEEGNSGWERVPEGSKAEAAGGIVRRSSGGKKGQLPGVPGPPRVLGVGR